MVEFVAPVAGWGVVVILRGKSPYHIVLGGLAEASVATGQSVASGAPVGKVGNEGSSRPELYLELRRGNSPVDPTHALSGASRRTAAK
ncbi:Peptidase family M23 [compost metagenome]